VATSIFTSQIPAILDGDDGTDYTLGTEFERSNDGSITHGRWYCPDPAPVSAQFVLYAVTGGTELARAVFGTLTPGAWNTVELPSPVAYVAGTNLVAAVYTPSFYTATASFFTGDLVNDDITAPGATNGRLGNTDEYPSMVSGNDACFFADIVFASGEVEPAEGVAELGLALTVAAAGARASAGAAVLGVQLDVAAAGARDSAGAAAAQLELAVAAAGARASVGTAAAGIVFTIAAVGARPSLGSAALGLALTVDAAGPVAEVIPGTLIAGALAAPVLTPGGSSPTLTPS